MGTSFLVLKKMMSLLLVAALAEKIVAFFNRSDLEHVHQVSYDIAKGF